MSSKEDYYRRNPGPMTAVILAAVALVLIVIVLKITGIAGIIFPGSRKNASTNQIIAATEESDQSRNLYGYVKDAESGEAIENAYVRIAVNGENLGCVTDEEGRYEIKNLAPGHYTLFVKAKNHNTSPTYGFDLSPGEEAQLQEVLLTPSEVQETETEEMPWDY